MTIFKFFIVFGGGRPGFEPSYLSTHFFLVGGLAATAAVAAAAAAGALPASDIP